YLRASGSAMTLGSSPTAFALRNVDPDSRVPERKAVLAPFEL
ncbi:MAG: hypothetical protein JWP53_3892, partial [Conexibacter sp.]|nr:hypothetical protein [Conexibacter sp.]